MPVILETISQILMYVNVGVDRLIVGYVSRFVYSEGHQEKTKKTFSIQEYCQLVPKEVCIDVVKEYPSLTIANECQYIPRQTCTPDDVEPKEITKPIIKKVCGHEF